MSGRAAFGADTTLPTFASRYPGNDQRICEIEIAGQPEIDRAVAAASEAFEAWAETPAVERGAILRRAARLLRDRNQELAELERNECG